MTRINTNVSALVAQTNLARSNSQLQVSLTRLSTGLRINSGADDPAGLIASQSLQSDIIGVQQGISNSQQATSLIATADSALGQVSTLLDSIRGLVSQSANTGALSDAQVAANQLQVDSSLQAIDRIATVTSFQGKRLLDGSLDFVSTSAGKINTDATGDFGAATNAAATIDLGKVSFTANSNGASLNGYAIEITGSAATADSGKVDVSYSSGSKVLTITVGNGEKYADVSSAYASYAGAASDNFASNFTLAISAGSSGSSATAGAISGSTAGGSLVNKITLTALNPGSQYNGVNVNVTAAASAGVESVSYSSSSNTVTVSITSSKTAVDLASAINASSSINTLFSATAANSGAISFTSFSDVTSGGLSNSKIGNLQINQANFGTASSVNVAVTVDKQATQGQLTYTSLTPLSQDLTLQVGGDKGFNVFTFGAGSTLDQIKTAIDTVSDATGVTADVDSTGHNLTLKSTDYGSSAFVSAKALAGSFATVDSQNNSTTRSAGGDVQARINGIKATGNGLQASLNSPTLDLSFSVDSNLTNGSVFNFSITGGGANFQLGPDVVTNQQARLGIQGVSTATLGGVNGTLYELRSGADKSLNTDVKGAAAVVDEVITQITSLRGRLGAFQQTTLQTNINTLQDTLSNLTTAQSNIQDADFAVESANLTRAQILVQSGTSVLQIANHNPQNVLSLLK